MNKHPCSSSTWIYRRKPPTCSIHHIITDDWGAQRGKKKWTVLRARRKSKPLPPLPPPPLLYTSLSPVYELCTQNPAHAVRGHCYSTMGLQRNCTKAHRPEPCPRVVWGGGYKWGEGYIQGPVLGGDQANAMKRNLQEKREKSLPWRRKIMKHLPIYCHQSGFWARFGSPCGSGFKFQMYVKHLRSKELRVDLDRDKAVFILQSVYGSVVFF